ncbi:MAG: SpoIIE family protein phosphatase [Treponema sp.]|jgi:serine phosphatase RsbU (regulator of sigma subunit)|nr:SpoIIE family protein phosphatase [Treponema sp.]
MTYSRTLRRLSVLLSSKIHQLYRKLDRKRSFLMFLLFLSGGFVYSLSDFYWETPKLFSQSPGSFPVSAYSEDLSLAAWQEAEAPAQEGAEGRIWVSIALKKPGEEWELRRRIGGPYTYSGTQPAILSAVMDSDSRIFIAAAASTTDTEILISDDMGESFSSYRIGSGSESSIAPRIYARPQGGYYLFITRGFEQSLSIYFARSQDGINWTPFELFVTDTSLNLNFLPTYAALGNMDYVIFQSFVGGASTIPAFQLFMKTSVDGGETWSAARLFTDFRDPVMNTSAEAGSFDNQRPYLINTGERLFLVWERRFGIGSPQIYGASIGDGGYIQGRPERINGNEAYCNNPMAIVYQGEPTVFWFDNRRGGNRIFLAQRSAFDWQNYDISGSSGDSSFARPIVDIDGIFIFWQVVSQGQGRIYSIEPDHSVAAPRLSVLNFVPSRRSRGDRVQVSWNTPPDPSGIIGFSWIWTKDEHEEPPKRIQVYNSANDSSTVMNLTALEDGVWYFSVIAQDFAGNWSRPARMEYIRDTTPPPAAAIVPPEIDEDGYLLSNTFSMNWNPPPASDVTGYTWNLEYVGSPELSAGRSPEEFEEAYSDYDEPVNLPARILGVETGASFLNQDDGIWRFTVSAIDEVGNIGPASTIFFRTNKYIPYTYVTYIDSDQDEQGIVYVRILGRGFSRDGYVYRIFLDRDGMPPYDREFYLNRRDYRINSDREISGLRVEDLEKGLYMLGMDHPARGRYVTAPLIAVDETGTVKFGDYSRLWQPSWIARDAGRFTLDSSLLIVVIITAFCLLGLVVSIRGIGSVIAETAVIQVEAMALLTGDFMPSEKKKRVTRIKRRGVGLRLKMASFTIVLVLLVVIMVSAPLYLQMTRTQQETLLQGLWDRSAVLLEGLASSARAYLPSGNVLELGFLPAQSAAIPEADYVTITGYSPGTSIFDDQVWATNDDNIEAKIGTAEFQAGVSRLEDSLSGRLQGIAAELNREAQIRVGDLTANIAALNQEGISLALRTDEESLRRLNDIQVTTRSLETRLNEALTEIGRTIGSEPEFSTGSLPADGNRRFIFFKPIMYRQGAEDYYFRGLVRLEVDISSIIDSISEGQQGLLRVILIVALAAIAIGAIGALVLSSLIIRPISRLVSHVERIRDTEDKAQLAGVDIHIRSRDEIAVLGNTINDMTHGLVKAAMAASDLSIGKEIQKKFIPLEQDRDGNKLTSGFKDAKNVQFFGYYEGAKGVSGDYFDYQDLDGRYYAVIKCDVAGKGIPAALIMIQVATMFLGYFKQWKPTAKGMHIEEVVYQINDFIETLAFKGRFAAFTLCLFDSQTGLVRFCNAGDNIVHMFDASEGRIKTVTLPETPATGVLPNFLVESKGGYTVQTLTLDRGDILLLFTDGIEEAKRKFRDSNFKEIICTQGDAPNDTPHENHVVGQGDEEMGPDRVQEIINAVMNKGTYTLHKWHNPEGDDHDLKFDFSDCEGKVEEVIMGMVSVEKMFRCYKSPNFDDNSRVLVDKKVDEYLKKHFLQYRNYCSYTRDYPGGENYLYYTGVAEDDQYDDLTILGIKRK